MDGVGWCSAFLFPLGGRKLRNLSFADKTTQSSRKGEMEELLIKILAATARFNLQFRINRTFMDNYNGRYYLPMRTRRQGEKYAWLR